MEANENTANADKSAVEKLDTGCEHSNATNANSGDINAAHNSTEHAEIRDIVVDVFRFSPWNTFTPRSEKCQKIKVTFLADAVCDPHSLLEDLNHLLFERLMIEGNDLPKQEIEVQISVGNKIDDHFNGSKETRILRYLYGCFYRSTRVTKNEINKEALNAIQNAIIEQTVGYLVHTDIYPRNDKSCTILDLLDDFSQELDYYPSLQKFIALTADAAENRRKSGDTDVDLFKIMDEQYYKALCKRFETFLLFEPKLMQNLSFIKCLISSPTLAKVFIDLNSPWRRPENLPNYNYGKRLIGGMDHDIQRTLLGGALNISCLVKPGHTNFEYFLSPSSSSPQEHSITAKNIGFNIKLLVTEIHSIFLDLLKKQETRNEMLNWIGLCLYAFRDRSKMWTNEMIMATKATHSDGFLLNLGSVLLMLCEPFSTPFSPKLLKIDPRYCKAQSLSLEHNSDDHSIGIHMRGLKDETFLVPSENGFENIPSSYNFMTEIFYCTHKALQVGFRSCHERFLRIASDLDQIQRVFEDASRQSMQDNNVLEMIRNQMDKGMTMFLNLKTALLQPDIVELLLKFNLSTATWLTNLAMSKDEEEASKSFKKVEVKGDEMENEPVSKCLSSVPEFVIDNISDIIMFVRRFSHKTLALATVPLEPLMTLILVFMGSPSKMKNPHSRARLAEVLEALMPRFHQIPGFNYTESFSVGEHLFTSHPQVHNLVLALLQVFVSIEMTGQSVAFEQKFQYRRPMYQVLKYLWTEVEEPHKRRMKEIAIEAENKIEDAKPPLFLRFINLLTNDAIFLLDEALGYMKKLRELQQERSSESWGRLSFEQRQNQEANYHHLGRLARFHNVIGYDTIHALSYLTEEIKRIFCHPVMVHRIAAMLNYFLSHLVGPKKKDFKVKGMDTEFEFKPAEIVFNICQIYINLGAKSNPMWKDFCSAVISDARSYSPTLLPNAADVLIRTGKAGLAEQIRELGNEMNKITDEIAKEEIAVEDIPDEFLDPIMNTLMRDPVKLPSGYRLDRSTIARHLLSDQTDPFTRKPLTMEMIETDNDLKEKIEIFLKNTKHELNKP